MIYDYLQMCCLGCAIYLPTVSDMIRYITGVVPSNA